MSATNAKAIQLVLLGGGHTNTQVIKHIVKSNVADNIHLILVSDDPISLYSGMCPGGVADQYKESELSIDLTAICQKLKWTFVCKQICEIDDANNVLIGIDGSCIKYDILSIDIGSTNLGIRQYEGVKDYAITTRPLKLLMTKVKKSELRLFKKIKQCNRRSIDISIIIVGGGCAGCELAFGLKNRLVRKIKSFMDKNALKIKVNVKCTLVTSAEQILMRDPKPLQLAVLNAMKDENIDIITLHKVVKMDKNCVYLRSSKSILECINYDICIWATGPAPHCIKTHNLRKHNGWFVVNKYLQSISNRNIFGAGDCICMNEKDTLFPPKSGVYAVREGPILIYNLMQYVKYGKSAKFRSYEPQNDFLRLLNLCNGKAIGCKHGIAFKGAWVWKLKDWIDVSWMNKFKINHLLDKDSKEFKPKIEENKQQSDEDIAVENAVKLLMIDDEPNECNGFALQWKILLRMNDDESYCKQVVELYQNLSQKMCKL